MSKAEKWAELVKEWTGCRKCKIGGWAYKHVLGVGSLNASCVFVGEGPGVSEDTLGIPFCGPAGRLLHRALDEVGFKEEDWFLTNLVCCRPCDGTRASNRVPSDGEIANCAPRLRQALAIIHPKLVIAVGRVPQRALAGLEIKAEHVQHPAWVLRNGGYGTSAYQEFARRLKLLHEGILL